MSQDISGIVVPVLTPVDAADRVDEAAFRSLLRFLVKSGVDGIFAGGSAGEGPLLTDTEWRRMSEIAFEECHGKLHLLGGAIDTSAARIIERARILKSIGYENFVVVPGYYLKLTLAEEHLRLFGDCKQACGDMNMIAYNIPACSQSIIAVETMCEMVQRKWITCCKDSSNDKDYFSRLISEAGPLGLRVLLGTEIHAAAAFLMGAHGLVPVCANVEPEVFNAAYRARSDAGQLAKLQIRITELVENLLWKPRSWLAGIKGAAAIKGYGSGKPVSGLETLNAQERSDLELFSKTIA